MGSEGVYGFGGFVVVKALYLCFWPSAEVDKDADGVLCGSQISVQLELFSCCDFGQGLAFHDNIPLIHGNDYIHLHACIHLLSMEDGVVPVFFQGKMSMLTESRHKCFLIDVLRHTGAEILVSLVHACNHIITLSLEFAFQLIRNGKFRKFHNYVEIGMGVYL